MRPAKWSSGGGGGGVLAGGIKKEDKSYVRGEEKGKSSEWQESKVKIFFFNKGVEIKLI